PKAENTAEGGRFSFAPILLCADSPLRRFSFAPILLCAGSPLRPFSFAPASPLPRFVTTWARPFANSDPHACASLLRHPACGTCTCDSALARERADPDRVPLLSPAFPESARSRSQWEYGRLPQLRLLLTATDSAYRM